MKVLAVLGVIAVLATAALDTRSGRSVQEEYLLVVDETKTETAEEILETNAEETEIQIQLLTGHDVKTVSLEEYLRGVVLSEMLPSFHIEALKAQAVAARTFAVRMLENGKHEAYDLCDSSACCQAWKSDAQLRTSLGSAYDSAMKNAWLAVETTLGEVITHENELIEAVYYSCSGGRSEPAVAVWGSDVPYLQTVESPGEESASAYSSTVRYSLKEFCDKMKNLVPDIKIPVFPQDWFGEIRRSDGGGVISIEICGREFSGGEIRQALGLRSTLFTPAIEAGEVVFSVKGYGHRVGMSQYGADAMGRNGKSYDEIICHYYSGVAIKKLSRTESGQLNWN